MSSEVKVLALTSMLKTTSTKTLCVILAQNNSHKGKLQHKT